jgi:hypothetical protein
MIRGQSGEIGLAKEAVERLLRDAPAVEKHFYPIFRVWRIPDDDIDRFADGLMKAGLRLHQAGRTTVH